MRSFIRFNDLRKVDFPHPEGPIKAVMLRSSISIFISFKACVLPYQRHSSFTVITWFIYFLYDVYRSKNTITSFLFNIVVQYNSDTVDFWFFSVAWLLNRSVLPLPLSELFICWMSRSVCSWVLISIKSTMIIACGYHGIRLYEREVQPHDLCRHWYCQT